MASERELARLRRGAALNFVGTAGRAGAVAFPFLAARAYGEGFGLYALAAAPVTVAGFLLSAGFADATQFLAAHTDDEALAGAQAARVRAAAIAGASWSVGLSAAAALALSLGGPTVARALFDRPELGPLLSVLALSLPFVAISAIATAVLRASMRMGGDVLVKSFIIPGALLAGLALAHAARPGAGAIALAWIHVGAQALGAGAAVIALARRWPRALAGARVDPAATRALWRFALPQSFNMALYQATFDLDLMLLGAAQIPADRLGAYRIASEIARQIFSVRVAFAGAYAGLIARLRHEGQTRRLGDSLGRISGWSVTIAAPAAAVVILNRHALLGWAGHAAAPSAFFVVLVLAGLLSCALGLAGNVIGMSGLPSVNLLNGVAAIALNAGCNALLVPPLGLLGAACASAGATLFTQIAQLVEARLLLGVRLRPGPLLRAFAPSAAGAGLVCAWRSGGGGAAAGVDTAVFLVGAAAAFAATLAMKRREAPPEK